MGEVQEYARHRARAAGRHLGEAVAACVDGLVENNTDVLSPEVASACGRLQTGCSDGASLRQAAAIVCKRLQKEAFELAGGDASDLEFQARRQARAAVGDAYLACMRLSATELQAAGAVMLANGTMPAGRRRAACLQEARAALRGFGLSPGGVQRELCRAAALQSAERVRTCVEAALATSGVTIGQDVALAVATGKAPAGTFDGEAWQTLKRAAETCRDASAAAVAQAGAPPGRLRKLVKEGPRAAAAETIRECIMRINSTDAEAPPTDAALQRCRADGALAFLLTGGEPRAFAEELLKAARATMRESLWACAQEKGLDLGAIKAQAWTVNQTEDAAKIVANCSASVAQTVASIAGVLNEAQSAAETAAQTIREAGEEELEAQLDASRGAVRALDEAIQRLFSVGAADAAAAEAALVEQLGCQPSPEGGLCVGGAVGPVVLGGRSLCCLNIPSQNISLGSVNASAIVGAGEAHLTGAGALAAARTDLERFCLGATDGAADPSCAEVVKQTAASVTVESGVLTAQGTAFAALSVDLGAGTVLETGYGEVVKPLMLESSSIAAERRLGDDDPTIDGRDPMPSAGAGFFQAAASLLHGTKITGEGRVDLGRAQVKGEINIEADTVAAGLNMSKGSKIRVKGRLVLSADVDEQGNLGGGVEGSIVVEGLDSLVVDGGSEPATDSPGETAGRAAIWAVWGSLAAAGNLSLSRPQLAKMAAACLRTCRQDAAIRKEENQCISKDKRKKKGSFNNTRPGLASRWGADVDGIDCGKAMKVCTRRCFLGPARRVLHQKLADVVLAGGGVSAAAGVRVEIQNLALDAPKTAGAKEPVLLGAPDDQGQDLDENGKPVAGGKTRKAALVVQKLTQAAAQLLSAGCDLSGFRAGDVKAGQTPAACVELPPSSVVKELVVKLPAAAGASALLGRRVVQFSVATASTTAPPKLAGRRRLGQSLRFAAATTAPKVTVVDDDGNPAAGSFRTCCFEDGFGVAAMDAPPSACPRCAGDPDAGAPGGNNLLLILMLILLALAGAAAGIIFYRHRQGAKQGAARSEGAASHGLELPERAAA